MFYILNHLLRGLSYHCWWTQAYLWSLLLILALDEKILFFGKKMEIIQFKWLLCPPVSKNMEENEKKN